jgi:SAM-dependent methyltransferase
MTLKLLDAYHPKRVLDCPAGYGAFTARLITAGFDVSCCDILPRAFQMKEPVCDFADLNESLPYPDSAFDAVVCLNGLHRVWARGRAIAEFSRVLQPGGHLILTFCNAANIIHRLLYALSGVPMIDMVGPPMTQEPYDEAPATSFRFPLTVNHVASVARHASMEIIKIDSCVLSIKSIVLAPLALGPLLFKVFAGRVYRDIACIDDATRFHALFSDFIVIVLRKTGE